MVKMWLQKINSRNSNLADLEQEILSFFSHYFIEFEFIFLFSCCIQAQNASMLELQTKN